MKKTLFVTSRMSAKIGNWDNLGAHILLETLRLLGVDPGWASCGVAVLTTSDGTTFKKERTWVASPKKTGFKQVIQEILSYGPFFSAGVERYVSYKGVTTSSSEDILMFIGAVKYALPLDPQMFRAIDWKSYIQQKLQVPSNEGKMDKVFSFAASSTILLGDKVKTDHEADAVGIAYTAFRKVIYEKPSLLPTSHH